MREIKLLYKCVDTKFDYQQNNYALYNLTADPNEKEDISLQEPHLKGQVFREFLDVWKRQVAFPEQFAETHEYAKRIFVPGFELPILAMDTNSCPAI